MVSNKTSRSRFQLVPTKTLPIDEVINYWRLIEEADLLKYRLPDVHAPSLQDVRDMICDPKNACFSVVDTTPHLHPIPKLHGAKGDVLRSSIAADIMLNAVQGAAAQLHFSVNPDYHGRLSTLVGKQGVYQTFELRRQDHPNIRLRTLIGLTPITNKLALRLVKNVGFKRMCVLTNAYRLAYSDDAIVDCVVSQLTDTEVDKILGD